MSRNLPSVKSFSKKKTDKDDACDPYKDIELYLEKAQEEITLTLSRRLDENENNSLDRKKLQFNNDVNVQNIYYGTPGIRNIADDGGNKIDQLQSILHELTQGRGTVFSNTAINSEGHGSNSKLSEGNQKVCRTYNNSSSVPNKDAVTTSNKSGEVCNLPSFRQAESTEGLWRDVCSSPRLRRYKDDSINASLVKTKSHHIVGSSAHEIDQCKIDDGRSWYGSKSPTSYWRNSGYSMSTGRKHAIIHASSGAKTEKQNYSTFKSDLVLASSKFASSTGSLDIHVLSNWANRLADEMNNFATQHTFEKFNRDDYFRFKDEQDIPANWMNLKRHERKSEGGLAKCEVTNKKEKDLREGFSSFNADDSLQFQMDDDDDDVFVNSFIVQKSTSAHSSSVQDEHNFMGPQQKSYESSFISLADFSELQKTFPVDRPNLVQEAPRIEDNKTSQDVWQNENGAALPEADVEATAVETSKETAMSHGHTAIDCHTFDSDSFSFPEKTKSLKENESHSEHSVAGSKDSTKKTKDGCKVAEAKSGSVSSDKAVSRCKDDSLTRTRLGSSPSSPLAPDDVRAFIRRVETSILESSEHITVQLDVPSVTDSTQVAAVCAGKDFCNTSTQTSPLVSRSSSFLWLSDLDLRDRPFVQQFDAVTGSVNSLLSSCSSLETFSEDSLSKSSCDDSDASLTDPYDECSQKDGNFLVIREENETRNSDTPEDLCYGNIKLSVQRTKPLVAVCEKGKSDDTSSTVAQVASDLESNLDLENNDIAHNQSLAAGKSFSEISIGKSSISTLSSSSLDQSSSSVQSVRDVHSESYISEGINSKSGKVNESELAVEGEFSKSVHVTVNKTSSLTPPPKLKPLVLRTLSAVSAPSSVASTPTSDFTNTSPASADIVLDHSVVSLSILDIASKSSSAPILDLRSPGNINNVSSAQSPSSVNKNICIKVIPPLRSQSVKELAELEAVEACKWLRAAGFPQYAQMFEDMQFPINIAAVQKDHYFLDQDSIQSLFRRLNALNRCARMRLDSIPRKTADDSDEEEQCALSENWTFQRQSRRWSRISSSLEPSAVTLTLKKESKPCKIVNGKCSTNHCNLSAKEIKMLSSKAHELDIPESPIPMEEDGSGGSASIGSLSTGERMDDSTSSENRSFRRTNSERLRDGAKAFLRRMESLKTRRSKRRNREAVVISGPQVLDLDEMQSRMQKLACVDITPPNSATSSPQFIHHGNNVDGRGGGTSEDNSSTNSTSDTSQTSTPTTHLKNGHWGGNHHGSNSSEHGAFSDSECSPTLWRAHCDANSNETKFIEHYIPLTTDLTITRGFSRNCNQVNGRTGSFNMGNDSLTFKEKFLERRRLKNNQTARSNEKRQGVYDNMTLQVSNKLDSGNYTHSTDQSIKCDNQSDNKRNAYFQDSDSCSSVSTNQDADSETQKTGSQTDESPVIKTKSNHQQTNVNWCPKQMHSTPIKFSHAARSSFTGNFISIGNLSSAQLMMLRKLSLLRLTSLMERYSPSNRSGWSWIMPKFIKRMKSPDYKDKVIFGVPLSVIYQQTGQPLPPSIQAAMTYLRQNAVESIGLFRKSGVRSRIQKLKNMNEANPSMLSYEGQQTYDVADMLKQYFRELPEALFTNKMSETFICIYQLAIPESIRHEALQSAIMLMPDENREVLHILLNFLYDISQQAHANQMNASNLSVCFAPSLFHMNSTRSSSSSPRRRKTVGVPDTKELNENKAANECLTYMIMEHKKLFAIPGETVYQCRLSVSDVDCVPLEELGHANGSIIGNWEAHVDAAIDEMMKESKDKFKGWVSLPTTVNAEISYRKVGDGNPLKLWKVSIEVEAPPIELLTRVLRERHLWDTQVLQANVVSRCNNSEIFHYVCKNISPLPARDYCIMRSWKTDLPKGSCVLVETSIDHQDAPVVLSDVRGYVLLSRYLIEPCGSGKSRITHISRIDTKGRSPEWYTNIYSHTCAVHLLRICESFRINTEGPESKV